MQIMASGDDKAFQNYRPELHTCKTCFTQTIQQYLGLIQKFRARRQILIDWI